MMRDKARKRISGGGAAAADRRGGAGVSTPSSMPGLGRNVIHAGLGWPVWDVSRIADE
jgi:hypothetical protein